MIRFFVPLLVFSFLAPSDAWALKAETQILEGWTSPAPANDYLPDKALPDGIVTYGEGRIASAWLEGPTRRYPHGVLGDDIEAHTVAAQLRNGRILRYRLDEDSVFEDRQARFVDINDDGEDELLVVRSYLDAGSAVTILAPGEGGLKIVAESEPIQLPNLWLNPVGVDDFDGDGEIEVALVETPHIGGVLRLLSRKGRHLVKKTYAFGFSNHAQGSRNMDLSLVEDVTGDGVPEIILPDALRRALRIVTFAGGEFKELLRLPLPEAVIEDFYLDEHGALIVPLSQGRAFRVVFKP